MIFKKCEFVTIPMVANRLGVVPSTVKKLIADGKLTAFRFGFSKRSYILKADVERITTCEEESDDEIDNRQ